MKPSSKTIRLDDPQQKVILMGKEFTVQEVKDEIIDAYLLKARLSQLIGGK